MTLTEQWKKGELEKDKYWVKYRSGKIDIWELSEGTPIESRPEIVEVLAPVPTYGEWQRLKEEYVDKYDKYLRLSTTNHQLIKFLEEFNALDVAKENQQLKELLKECRDDVNNYQYICLGTLTKIDNAIGEKKC